MCKKFTPDELNKMDHKTKDDVIYQMQDRLDRLEQNYENLIEQVRLANQQRFGRQTEKLDDIAGQLSFFNEAEANYDEAAKEPTVEEVIDSSRKMPRKPKKSKGQILRSTPNTAPLICGAYNTQPEGLLTTA